jgi:hypothetical protein
MHATLPVGHPVLMSQVRAGGKEAAPVALNKEICRADTAMH